MSSNLELIHLLTSFPSMANARIQDWSGAYITRKEGEGGLLDLYLGASSGQKRVIEFCLSVWNQDTDWTDFGFRPFNVAYAIGIWDDRHRAAFMAWAEDPFFL
jgi:hypothetical protein